MDPYNVLMLIDDILQWLHDFYIALNWQVPQSVTTEHWTERASLTLCLCYFIYCKKKLWHSIHLCIFVFIQQPSQGGPSLVSPAGPYVYPVHPAALMPAELIYPQTGQPYQPNDAGDAWQCSCWSFCQGCVKHYVLLCWHLTNTNTSNSNSLYVSSSSTSWTCEICYWLSG